MADKNKGSVGALMATDPAVQKLIDESLEKCVKGFQTTLDKVISDAIRGLAAKEDVLKIAANLENFVTRDNLNTITSELITKDQWNEALDSMLSTAVPLSGIHPGLATGFTLLEPIASKWLEGLVFRSARTKKTDSGTVNHPTERPLTPADVLSWNDSGAAVSFVTADGQKYTVDKE